MLSRRVLQDDQSTTRAEEVMLTIPVRPGYKSGTRITFTEAGDQAPGTVPADVVFIVAEKPHERFKREGNNLVFVATIPLVSALTGFVVDVLTLDERLLSVPINDVVHPAYEKIVPGEGMPLTKSPEKRGDLVLRFKVVYPEHVSTKQRDLLRQAFPL